MSKVVYNKSKTYLLPLLSELIEFDLRFINSIENVYMYDDMGKYENCLYVRHSYAFNTPEFAKYESKLTDNELFVDYVDINNEVLYIYKIPEEYLHEYNCLEQGRYSAFGIDAKELILKFWKEAFKHNNNIIPFLLKVKQILFKDKKLKELLEKELSSPKSPVTIDDNAELGSIIDRNNETFELSKYLKK